MVRKEIYMKKALIFDPYLDTLGGGERYTLTFALALLKNGYTVDLAWPTRKELVEAEKRFGFDLSDIHTDPDIYKMCNSKTSLKDRWKFTKQYDLVFWVSDGSVPLLFSKNNLIHFQVPFKKLGGNIFTNYLKSLFVHKYVYNSKFTQKIVEKNLPPLKGFVLYPPIDTDSFKPAKKENLILSVARFDPSMTSKHQDILLEAFSLLASEKTGYKLVLAGGLKGDETPVKNLKKLAGTMNVEFMIKPDFNKLKELYGKAKYFWHAAGFGTDETKNPENVEHFGMTTVEAMSAGAIPIVINKGGQKEIITGDSGFLSEDEKEIATRTLFLIDHPEIQKVMSDSAIFRSKSFSTENFYEKVKQLLF